MILLTIIVIISCPHHSSGQDQIINGEDSILDCLHSSNLSQLIHLPENSTYTSVLQFSLKNTRFNTTAAIKPSIIVTPDSVPQIQATVLCSKTHNVHIRIRSGGHDFEGLSYTSQGDSLSAQQQTPTAWVQAAVTTEMSWAMSNLFFSGFTRELPLESLLDRTISAIGSAKSKVKSDYVKDPIPMSGLEGIWEKLKEVDAGTGGLITAAYGGKMREISESSIPFPHRDGIIYQVQELTFWGEDGEVAADRQINWLRGLYDYMAPFVSKNPREAYVNYRDLDLGTNGGDGADAGGGGESWELKYFKGNLDRLVKVKTAVDAGNLFRNEQSIQPL
ncbi:Berberine bridge enzyme-like 24 [Linum grandiflorum]